MYGVWVVWLLLYAHRHRSIFYRGGWSHYTDTSETVDGNGAQNMVTVQSGFQTKDLLITGPMRSPTALTGPTEEWRDSRALLMLYCVAECAGWLQLVSMLTLPIQRQSCLIHRLHTRTRCVTLTVIIYSIKNTRPLYIKLLVASSWKLRHVTLFV
jgi:hypothetical protein